MTQVAAGVPRPSCRIPPLMKAFWPWRSTWKRNVFEPPTVNEAVVWFGATSTAPAPLPTRRATFTGWPDVLEKVRMETGSSMPGVALWSLQRALRVPSPPMVASVCGAPGALSLTAKTLLMVDVLGTPDTNLPGRRPLPGPLPAVATRLPAARDSVELEATASLPSTLPALAAKLTAAMEVPPSETNKAMPATTIDGDGREIFMVPPRWR